MRDELPAGWAPATLGQVVGRPRAKAAPTALPDLPFVGMDSIAPGGMSLKSVGRFGDMKSAGGVFEPGDVLYGRMRPYLNKVHLAKQRGACSAEFIVLPPGPSVRGDFLAYLVHQRAFVNFASEQSSGDRPRVDFEALASFRLGLPPKPEQQRIVSRIEELFSEIDEGERALARVGQLVERYRQSVLKAAVTGELTREWRALHGAELAADEACAQDIAGVGNAPRLPAGWRWASMDDLLLGIEAGKSFKCDERPPTGTECGLVKVSAVTWGVYDEEESKTITDSGRIDLRYLIREGDFLFSRANTIELVGASVVVHRVSKRLLLSDKILRFTFRENVKAWVDLVLKSSIGRAQIEALSTGNQESMRNIGQERIRMLMIPMPPVQERVVVEEMVRQQLRSAAAAREEATRHVRVSSALRQSILKAAFSGQLVPQDPADEPASALLARLAAQFAAAPPAPKRRGRKMPA